ncbi:MAG: tRNA lysidine(34) synthetase TilS [Oscillospiraceae bacterium]|nr:tRNA lysidine(34) synthetase TilS [Oscillospiraceae bacterium]
MKPEFIEKIRHVPEGAAILCALSGGADSTAMTAALVELSARMRLTLAAAHYHHGLRAADADADLLFCERLCAAWGIPLYHERGDVAAERGGARSRGAEADGRRLRYDFLERVARERGISHIATAHTADDGAETLLLNLIRGSGIDGLTGIPPVRGNIIRPILACTRAEVLEYLAQKGLNHREDATNRQDAYRRNRLRRHVIPLLAAENPALPRTLLRTAELISADAEYLNGLAARALEGMMDGYARKPRAYDTRLFDALDPAPDGRVCAGAAELAALPPPLARRAARMMAARAAGADVPDLSRAHIEAILGLCRERRGGVNRAVISLPGGLAAEREYDGICLYAVRKPDGFEPAALRLGERAELPELGLWVSWQKKPTKVNNLVYSFEAPSDIINGVMRVRPRKTGDRIKFPGRATRSLQDIFVDAKLPRRLRDRVPVVEEITGGGIIAVYGFGARGAGPENAGGGTVFDFYRE